MVNLFIFVSNQSRDILLFFRIPRTNIILSKFTQPLLCKVALLRNDPMAAIVKHYPRFEKLKVMTSEKRSIMTLPHIYKQLKTAI